MVKQIIDFPNYIIKKDGTVINITTNYTKKPTKGKAGYFYIDLSNNGKTKRMYVHRLIAIHYIPNPSNLPFVNHIDGDKTNNSINNLEWVTHSKNCQHAWDIGLQKYRRNYSLKEYQIMLLEDFFKQGKTITEIAKTKNQGLTRLSYHLREAAGILNILDKYENALKLRKNLRAKKAGEQKRKQIILQMLDKNTEDIIKIFSSVQDATNYLNKKSSGHISNAISSRTKTAYGYKWKSFNLTDYSERKYTQVSGNV